MKKIIYLIPLLFILFIPLSISAESSIVKVNLSLYGYTGYVGNYTNVTDMPYKLDIYLTPLEGEHTYNIVLGHNYRWYSSYNNSRVFVFADDSVCVPFSYILYLNGEVIDTADAHYNSSNDSYSVVFEQNFCSTSPTSSLFRPEFGFVRITYAYINGVPMANSFNWTYTGYMSAFRDFVRNNSVGAYTGFYSTGLTSSNKLVLTGSPSVPAYEYSSELGYVTNVRYNTSRILNNNEPYSVLDVVCGRYTSKGVDLADPNGNYKIEYRIAETGSEDIAMSIKNINILDPSDGLNYNYNLLRNRYNLLITPTSLHNGVRYFGDTYIIPNITNTAIGSVVLDNYMKDSNTGNTTNLNTSNVYIKNYDISNVTNEGDTITENYNTNYISSNTEYNYTTTYDTVNNYNDNSVTNNYENSPSVNIGPASPYGEGIDFLNGFNWSKFLTSLLAFFTSVTVLLPLLTGLLSFLPLWATGLLESCIMACLLFSLARGVFTIIKGVTS